MSLDAGNSGDEDGFHVIQGRHVVNFYETHGKDTTCLSYLQDYPSSPDVIAEFFNRKLGVEDINITRHVFNSFLGWLAILAVGLTACLIGGFRAGVFAILLLFFSPHFLGHAFNNLKDIPLASAVMMSLYGMFLFFKQFPKVKWYTFVILILSIAFAVSVRVGGLILVGYFGLFGFVFLVKILVERWMANRTPSVPVKQSTKKNSKYIPKKQ
ncbi:MAG: phospholipid carrier-dependent glycosyltransferase, partial [Bacteroidales bacterium]|nr:phospholipid carrier-dependent glycosyltransferase [Bacteroidales bacterium]